MAMAMAMAMAMVMAIAYGMAISYLLFTNRNFACGKLFFNHLVLS